MCLVEVLFDNLQRMCSANPDNGRCGIGDHSCVVDRCPLCVSISSLQLNREPVGDEGEIVMALKGFGYIKYGMTGEIVIDGEQHEEESNDYVWIEWNEDIGGYIQPVVQPYRKIVLKRCYPVVRHAVVLKSQLRILRRDLISSGEASIALSPKQGHTSTEQGEGS